MRFNPILYLTGRAVGWEKRDRVGEGGGGIFNFLHLDTRLSIVLK